MRRLSFMFALLFSASMAFAGTPDALAGTELLNCTQNECIQENFAPQSKATLTAILPSGDKMVVSGTVNPNELIALNGQTFTAPGRVTDSWVHIHISIHCGYVDIFGKYHSFNGWANWIGPGDDNCSRLNDYLLEILRNCGN